MKHFILTGLLLSFFFPSIKGQSDNRPKDGPGFYFNSFQNYKDYNADSAMFFVRKLASNPSYFYTLDNLLHNSFAQSFQKIWEMEITDTAEKAQFQKSLVTAHLILNGMMTDRNQTLVNAAQPIFFWTQIQQNENDHKKLIELTNNFTTAHLSTNDLYKNKVGRYALLIYQVISKKKALEKISGQLFKTIVKKLKSNQINVNVDTASRQSLEKRAWYRYLYAYTSFMQGKMALEKKKNTEAGAHFKTAFNYSPDLTDNNNSSAYFYDMYFLMEKEKRTFQDDYLNYLITHSINKQQTLSTLLAMALTNPANKEQLKSFYNTNFPNREAFNEYWTNNINKISKDAPAISLKKTDGLMFSSTANKSKWILIDFWGTWCSPCRKEHPDLEKFYQAIKTSFSDKITLITVACKDNEDKVVAYMAQFNYTFPVAMADNKIENVYNIKGYPSKILISPQGKYLIVPFGVDWIDFIKKYADL